MPSNANTKLLRVGTGFLLFGLCCAFSLLMHSFLVAYPDALEKAPSIGRRVLDRDGRLLARTMAKDGVFREVLETGASGPHIARAMVAAEDKRFFQHGGIDLLAIARAAAQALASGRLVSGASTITQQLARTTFERPRSFYGKWKEMALALRIERELEKDEILEHYLNRVHFGPQIVGAAAASDHFFGKPLTSLSLSEAATLAGLVRGPTLYDPRVRPQLALLRRDRVLSRMVRAGLASAKEVEAARTTPLKLLPKPPLPGAHHWVRWIGRARESGDIQTTLDGDLQRRAETLVAERARELSAHDVGACSVIVMDNETGEILAWVGSPDFHDEAAGQNDGNLAKRQPGSTLKPFFYAMAIEKLGLNASSWLPDEPTFFRTAEGFYSPQNFDRRYRGRVRLRRALSNSLNVPAVQVVQKLGVSYALERLREFGFSSLVRGAEHYGPALALGDGEVSLLELTGAYAVLARGGLLLPPRFVRDEPSIAPVPVLAPEASAVITEILSDDAARREAFGGSSALELPFPVAVKTGTSKGYRDSWTVGFTRAITVGVWVGNFEGHPTRRMTGARGAAPLFHRVMNDATAMLARSPRPGGKTQSFRPLHDVDLRQVRLTEEGRPQLFLMTNEQADSVELAMRHDTPTSPVRMQYPVDGMQFEFDPAIPEERQRIVLKASDHGSVEGFLINDQRLIAVGGQAEWVMRKGTFLVSPVLSERRLGEAAQFTVR